MVNFKNKLILFKQSTFLKIIGLNLMHKNFQEQKQKNHFFLRD